MSGFLNDLVNSVIELNELKAKTNYTIHDLNRIKKLIKDIKNSNLLIEREMKLIQGFQKFKATRDGKCSNCGRTIKNGDYLYYNSEKKIVYCESCHNKKDIEIEEPQDLNINSKLDGISLKLDHFYNHVQVLHTDAQTMEKQIKQQGKTIQELISLINKLVETVPEKE